ncbi:hypothetical protein ZIOFF_046681 [Zingiber officinale]|uniref:Cell wall protein n=2 Tax=Zingiber officinale TaxID=94328 RepID=A0A8J5FLB2_ZINOF|nr:hypothetical protein ZIOFF_046681 [Zingiber officinale]
MSAYSLLIKTDHLEAKQFHPPPILLHQLPYSFLHRRPMAASSHCRLLLLLLAFSAFAFPAALAGRGTPASLDKKEPEFLGVQEGTVLIPGIGRYALGSHELPAVRGLDSSGPAAKSGQFLPGIDDTFVPNPGLEIPNPFRPTTP